MAELQLMQTMSEAEIDALISKYGTGDLDLCIQNLANRVSELEKVMLDLELDLEHEQIRKVLHG